MDGYNVYYDLSLAPWEAVLGTEIEIPAIDRKIRLRIKEDTESGTELRIPGQGLPTDREGQRGDLYAVVDIVTPTGTSEEDKALWRQLASSSSFDPRK